MKCECGFIFSGAGEFRNAIAFLGKDNKFYVVCPNCNSLHLSD